MLLFFLLPKELNYLFIYLIIGKILVLVYLFIKFKDFSFFSNKLIKTSLTKQWKELISSSHFFYNGVFSMIYKSLPILLLYKTLPTDSYNAFVIILKISLITSVSLDLLNNYVSKNISNLLEKNDIHKIKNIYFSSSKVGFFLGITTFVLLFFFGHQLIDLWGTKYENAYYMLLILFFGDLIDLSFASTGVILNLCGKKKILNKLYLYLIPITSGLIVISSINFGLMGVVISLSVIKVSFNLVKYMHMKIFLI